MSSFTQGVLLILVYNLLSASKGVLLGSLLQGLDPFLLLFCSFSIVAVFFSVTEWLHPSPNNPPVTQGGKDLAIVNIMTAIAWATFYLSMKNMEPAVATAVANSLGPITTIVIAVFLGVGSKPKNSELFTSLGVLGSMSFLIGSMWLGKGGLTHLPPHQIQTGLCMAIVCGISMAINTMFSKRLNAKGWSARKILAHRFYVLIVMGAFLLPSGTSEWLFNSAHLATILMIAAFGVIIPLYAFQVGLEKLDAIVVALILATVPLFSLAVQSFDGRIHFSAYSLIGILCVMFFSCLGVLIRANRFQLARVQVRRK